MDLDRYSKTRRILNLKPGSSCEPFLGADEDMEQITRLNHFLLVLSLHISRSERLFQREQNSKNLGG